MDYRLILENLCKDFLVLYHLTIEKNEFIWRLDYEQIRCTVLVIFDPQCPIELHTDASSRGYGAILLHKINKCHVIEYFSKAAPTAESRYHSYEFETLPIVLSIKHFRHILTNKN